MYILVNKNKIIINKTESFEVNKKGILCDDGCYYPDTNIEIIEVLSIPDNFVILGFKYIDGEFCQ